MAQKFGNGRWVREGFLDNRMDGTVVGQVVFAGVGPVDFYLRGNFKPDIAGEVIRFSNSRFEDDETAGHVIGDMANPQIGTVNLISLDPHPNLEPHPYVEWFTLNEDHFRFQLSAGDAWVLSDEERKGIEGESRRIREALADQVADRPRSKTESDWV
ncbi:MAG: hypothetical protein A4C66_01225 [Nitrospira sp. HN-bin3]|uniref:hypothetical protein n=1 Tax=Nitrospira cf. moscoviensis SBR1015 TaxID=96242 RepID=UPI000A0E2DF9|nr:hypothetical protein [Nitrospira cf. moscoviensis SBR1015]OQW51335.1 MAG: hypothetical protein A4C66_01225 [Nitrospira sp. HN-bin3]